MLNVEVRHPAQRSLRLAVVTETYPPEVNGVAMTIARLVEGLRARNHSIQLVRPRQDKTETTGAADSDTGFHEVLMRGLPIPRYPHLKMGVPSKKALVELWSLRRPDLVHIVTEGPLGWSALQAARRLKLPVTSDFRTHFASYSQHYGVGWLRKPIAAYLRKFHNHTQCTMVPTQALRAELASAGFQRLRVVARGVDTQRFNPGRRSLERRAAWGAGPDTLVMLSVGRLAAEKNLDVVLTAYEAARRTAAAGGRDVRLVIAGDGPLRPSLQQRCPTAHFAGMRSHAELALDYASADLFVFPSLTETFGNVTMEALASGLPVLAFDCAAAAEWVRQGHNGWLLPAGDVTAFVDQAARLAAAPGQVREAATCAATEGAKLDWSHIAAQVEEVFLQAIRAQTLPRA